MLQRAVDSGHCVGSHTWSHANLTTLDDDGVRLELSRLEDAFTRLTGKKPNFFRPPFGSYNSRVVQILSELGYNALVLWNEDTNDWDHPEDVRASVEVFKQAVRSLNPASASIVSLDHDILPNVTDIIIDATSVVRSEEGWRFVTMEECLGVPCYR
ncbi:carbohydrate esterase family 4 protein [Gonapodya prolifera JEL478]|uniref:Carbohydrate esterase family 4 protein n=1 Tax=Gonapodya prolifera (strain JEL478) TaxID=1344416 RepID=A0A139AQT4_GONPJ|nr:carbohydrate esterase family 4 protein [Gonapodya prolifera JEL478]|eukprot:KXS19014.1 carbohydrate esterase family 4 protein [Gonapodya prolifera JEL478]